MIWLIVAYRRDVPSAVPISPPDFDANRSRFKRCRS
jgi:hypothetical protein